MTIEYENKLRLLIMNILGSSDSTSYGVTTDRIEAWKKKRIIERKKYEDRIPETRILYYSDFYDLKKIITKNWEKFQPIFKDKKRFETYFSDMEKFRNTISHGRELTTGQLSLMKGIVDDLNTRITMYHNKNENKNDYFVRVLSFTDNLGNSWNINEMNNIRVTLKVGDEYEVAIDAYDPKGRTIKYKILFTVNGKVVISDTKRIKVKITDEFICNGRSVLVTAYTPGSAYKNEHIVGYIMLTVLPME